VRRLPKAGSAIIVVEHDMGFSAAVDEPSRVPRSRRVIALGTPDEVRDDPAVASGLYRDRKDMSARRPWRSEGIRNTEDYEWRTARACRDSAERRWPVLPNEAVGLIGAETARQTSLMRAIMGIGADLGRGTIRSSATRSGHSSRSESPARGIGYSPEGRRRIPRHEACARILDLGRVPRGNPR